MDLEKSRTVGRLQEVFSNLLLSVSRRNDGQQPLLIALDSLDQLNELRLSAKACQIIVKSLLPLIPKGVYVLFSVVADCADLMEALRVKIADPQRFFEVEPLQADAMPALVTQIMSQKRSAIDAGAAAASVGNR